MLEINASIGFPGRVVLREVAWQVGAGEAVVLVGRNGSGKTTLLRSVAGILAPRGGSVTVQGSPAHDQRSRAFTGFVPDPPPLYEELSPWEHIELVQRLWSSGAVSEESVDHVVAALRLESYLNQRCDTLSLGMRKRLGIALALLHGPDLLLLDEPFNGLDAASTRRVRALLAAHVERGGAFIASTHQPQLLESVATRVTVIHDGAFFYDGDPSGWDPALLPEGLDEDDEDDEDDQDD